MARRKDWRGMLSHIATHSEGFAASSQRGKLQFLDNGYWFRIRHAWGAPSLGYRSEQGSSSYLLIDSVSSSALDSDCCVQPVFCMPGGSLQHHIRRPGVDGRRGDFRVGRQGPYGVIGVHLYCECHKNRATRPITEIQPRGTQQASPLLQESDSLVCDLFVLAQCHLLCRLHHLRPLRIQSYSSRTSLPTPPNQNARLGYCLSDAGRALDLTCYYPDGITVSTDEVCNSTATASSCCPSSSFCLDNGLCFGEGVVSRGSCSDPTWASDTCAGYCKNEEKSSAVPITPCGMSTDGATTFGCGANSSVCLASDTFTMSGGSTFVLRTSQIASLIGSVTNALPTSTNSTTGLYTGGQLAGIGIGVALPLFLGLLVALLLLYRERQKHNGPKPIQRLTDDMKNDFLMSPPPRTLSYAGSRPSTSGGRSIPPSRGSTTTVASTPAPAHLATMLARYETTKTGRSTFVDETEMMPTRRHELVGSPAATPPPHQVVFRHELPDNTRSPR
nr:hypothetical protein CFP56_12229 [Quercus suber]